jgi:hypothetical protein
MVVVALAITAGTAIAQPAEPPPSTTGEVYVDDVLARVEAASPTIKKVVRGAVRRARRAISIGPTVGAFGGSQPSPGEYDGAITFGLGVEIFKLPILPTPESLKALVMERAKAKLKDQLAARLAGGQAPPLELEQMARQIWDEAIQEVLGLENVRPKTMERPRLTLAVEANRFMDSDVWAARFRGGIGIWKVTLGGSLAVAFTDPETSVFTGVELATHLLTSKNPRASVVDVFVRGDFEVRNRDVANADMYVAGARFLFDLI